MKTHVIAAALLALTAVATPEQRHFRFERPLNAPLMQSGQTCVALDTALFEHALRNLADLRLYRDMTETPYAIDTAVTGDGAPRMIQPINAGVRNGQTVFDAQMPDGNYSDVQLSVGAQNFIATVTVTGSHEQGAKDTTQLGEFTIFDFTREKLGRSTVLHLHPSSFRMLHFAIAGPIAPADLTGVVVWGARERKAVYQTVAETSQVAIKGHASWIEFILPAQVPVDRIVFVPGSGVTQFSRQVSITVEPSAPNPDSLGNYSTVGGGNLLRIHSVHNGRRIDEENLTVDALGVAGDGEKKWTIRVENGDDTPIAFKSVRLEMRERRLCFDGAAGARYALYYGDPALYAPRYDYATLFSAQDSSQVALMGPETLNPRYVPRPDTRPFTERHPALLWIALLAVIALLGLIALRSLKGAGSPHAP